MSYDYIMDSKAISYRSDWYLSKVHRPKRAQDLTIYALIIY